MRRWASGAGLALLALWLVWWGVAFARNTLPFADKTWFEIPIFGADFWSQSDYASRLWLDGGDPYLNEKHLFHYPPIVIRLFLWTPFFSVPVALRIWIVFLTGLIAWATILALRVRRDLGATELPATLALAAVLFSLPVVFQLERANFDLITLLALVLAIPLMGKRTLQTDLLAGALLAFGPWVKIYPGLVGLGLLALRRYRVFGGFVLGCVAIFAVMPSDAIRSFKVLRKAIKIASESVKGTPYATWSHSLSIAWKKLCEAAADHGFGKALTFVKPQVFAFIVVGVPLAYVCYRVFRTKRSSPLAFPFLLWIIAIASFVPQIANDYSLVFLPIAAVGVFGLSESRANWALFLAGLVSLQPIAFPVPGLVLLVSKLCAVVAVGLSVVRRARELDLANDTANDAPAKPA